CFPACNRGRGGGRLSANTIPTSTRGAEMPAITLLRSVRSAIESVRRRRQQRPASPRLWLEQLEDRSLLSAVTVDRLTANNPTGGGIGSGTAGDLRWCLVESLIRADTINFSVTGTINLAAGLPTLTRSVSIEGPGADQVTVRRDTGGTYHIFAVA